jgi:hypothetical protein
MQLTVYFDGQFWVGVAEDTCEEGVRVVRHVFGAEPQDTEVFSFVNRVLLHLLAQTPISLQATPENLETDTRNPKRRAREAALALRARGISTRSQQALKDVLESMKRQNQELTRDQREAEAMRKHELKRVRAKERHRGH